MSFKLQLVELLAKATAFPEGEIVNLLAIPPDPKLGDYAFPCFKLGKNPKEAAQQLKSRLILPSFIANTVVAGPYLNFFFNQAVIAEQTIREILAKKKKYGAGHVKRNIVLEYCSPNTNKPLHLGHLRNMALGDAASRILSFVGNTVHKVEVVNDRGIHICKSMLAYQKWGHRKKPDKKGDHFVGDYYVLFAKAEKEDEAIKKEAQELLLQWELKDPTTRALWKKMNRWVLGGFKKTYKRFGISFDKEYFESGYYEKAKEVVEEGLQRGIFHKDHTAAVLAPLEAHGLPNKVLLRGDETSIYITQDLYLAKLRYEDFHFDQMIFVVASEQNLHFQQLFKILELLQRPYAKNLFHLSYGLVHLPSGRMKSREGTVVDADDIMDEISALAHKEVRNRYQNMPEKEIKKRAEFIALAAIKFFMLRTDAVRDLIFNPEESLSFEGETGPYLQYTHARACSIIRKAGTLQGKINFELLQEPIEKKVIKLLASFPETAHEAARHYKPHLLCRHALDTAQAFNEFYQALSVISDDKEMMKARLALVKSVQVVLYNGLTLLGIHPPQEM